MPYEIKGKGDRVLTDLANIAGDTWNKLQEMLQTPADGLTLREAGDVVRSIGSIAAALDRHGKRMQQLHVAVMEREKR